MTEEIITALAGIAALRVASRTSSFAFKGKDTDVRQIGRELGVRHRPRGQRPPGGPAPAHHGAARSTSRTATTSGPSGTTARCRTSSRSRTRSRGRSPAALKVRLLPAQEALARRARHAGRRGVQPLPEGPVLLQPARVEEGHRGVRGGDRPRSATSPPRTRASPTPTASAGSTAGSRRREAFAKARAAASGRRSSSPIPPEVHLALGIIDHYYGWDLEREERHLRRAIELAPQSAEAYSWLACLLSAATAHRRGARARRGGRSSSSRSRPTRTSTRRGRTSSRAAIAEADRGLPQGRGRRSRRGLRALGARHGLPGGRPARGGGSRRSKSSSVLTGREMPWALALLGGSFAAAGRADEAREILAELESRPDARVRPAAPPRLRPGAARARRRPLSPARPGARGAQRAVLGLGAFEPGFRSAADGPAVPATVSPESGRGVGIGRQDGAIREEPASPCPAASSRATTCSSRST